MAGRRTNLALLALLALAFASGAVAFGIGTGWALWPVAVHSVAGLGVLVLAPWKSTIVRRGLARRRAGSGASVAFGVLVVVAVATGVAHSTGVAVDLGPISTMQVHVGAALLAVPLLVAHVVARPQRPQRVDLSRRQFLRAGVVAGTSTAVYAGLGGLARLASLPGSRRRFTGSHETSSLDPRGMPVTQWLDDDVQDVDPSAWSLTVRSGGADRSWSYAALAAFDDRVLAALDCTGGWWSSQEWEGVWLSSLLGDVGDGRSVVVRSRTGYNRRFPIRDAERILLATRVGGRPLSPGHGFPVRVVAPGRRGFWWVKWVEAVEVERSPWWLAPPFPLS